jgi:hypothetical protein
MALENVNGSGQPVEPATLAMGQSVPRIILSVLKIRANPKILIGLGKPALEHCRPRLRRLMYRIPAALVTLTLEGTRTGSSIRHSRIRP